MATINLLDVYKRHQKKSPSKERHWYYQHKGEEKKELYRDGKYWYYETPLSTGSGRIGTDSLRSAKGDLSLYEGTKIWSELE